MDLSVLFVLLLVYTGLLVFFLVPCSKREQPKKTVCRKIISYPF
ncbi:hypothetical protein HNO89_000911 [Sporosarcina luteola]|nr:hypothetical protein [Sporosarcina luteola]